MENKLQNVGQNSIMDNFVKTDDIFKDMCGIIEASPKVEFISNRKSSLYKFSVIST